MGKVIQLSIHEQPTVSRTGGRERGPQGERKYIRPDEFDAVLKALDRNSRTFERDYALLTIAYHHGTRLSELVGMQTSDVDWKAGTIYVRRLKGSISSEH